MRHILFLVRLENVSKRCYGNYFTCDRVAVLPVIYDDVEYAAEIRDKINASAPANSKYLLLNWNPASGLTVVNHGTDDKILVLSCYAESEDADAVAVRAMQMWQSVESDAILSGEVTYQNGAAIVRANEPQGCDRDNIGAIPVADDGLRP